MRLSYVLAIALWLSFPVAGTASRQQDPAGSANPTAQAPPAPAAPAEDAPAQKSPKEKANPEPAAEQAPAESTPAVPANPQTPAAQKKAQGSEAQKRMNASSANGTRKPRKRSVPPPNGTPQKIVVREGGASEPAAQIAPGMTPAEAARQRQNAETLLGSTDNQLKQLAGRTLDARQQETVGQAHNYMDGARSALKEGDVRRASTLAEKANLLAEDLAKH